MYMQFNVYLISGRNINIINVADEWVIRVGLVIVGINPLIKNGESKSSICLFCSSFRRSKVWSLPIIICLELSLYPIPTGISYFALLWSMRNASHNNMKSKPIVCILSSSIRVFNFSNLAGQRWISICKVEYSNVPPPPYGRTSRVWD